MRYDIDVQKVVHKTQRFAYYELAEPGLYWVDPSYRWFLLIVKTPMGNMLFVMDISGIRPAEDHNKKLTFERVPEGTVVTMKITA